MNEWPEEDIAYLQARWGRESASSIGIAIGRTRNAVCGKAHRLNLPDLGSPIGKGAGVHREQRLRTATAKRPTKVRPEAKPVPERAPEPAALPTPEVIIPSRFEKVKVAAHDGPSPRISELQRGQCLWPINAGGKGEDHRFCGQPAEAGRPYCAAHRAKARGKRSETSMAIGRENARRQARLSHAEFEAKGAGVIQRIWRGD